MGFEHVSVQELSWAFALGAISAISLPLGALVGINFPLSKKLVGCLMAFGGGALLSALAIELVAPHAEALSLRNLNMTKECEYLPIEEADHPVLSFFSLLTGMVVGGLIFVLLDEVINSHGGFLRKYAIAVMYLQKKKEDKVSELMEHFMKVKYFEELTSEMLEEVVDLIHLEVFHDREVIFTEGDVADRVFFINKGDVMLNGQNTFSSLRTGDFLGEYAVLTGKPHTDTATAMGDVHLWYMLKSDFDQLRLDFPIVNSTACHMVQEREHLLLQEDLQELDRSLESVRASPHPHLHNTRHSGGGKSMYGPLIQELDEIDIQKESHSGSPMAIWLGILLDGIPESFIIGSEMNNLIILNNEQGIEVSFLSVVPYTLIAGLFLSNFPEALSSSQMMMMQGMSKARVLLLWSSLTVVTALGAALGCLFGELIAVEIVVAIEGLAAGAMLTMIASTMLPEACSHGGSRVTGLATLGGFVCALLFKIFE